MKNSITGFSFVQMNIAWAQYVIYGMEFQPIVKQLLFVTNFGFNLKYNRDKLCFNLFLKKQTLF